MRRYKNLVLLHTNDMHGDFLSETVGDKELGGISMLSGYINKVKAEAENDNVLYCVSGDMLQGSLIDTEFKGISTIEIMNQLNPDIVTLGNHEVDYGLGHLLLLEKCAKFPIVNANLFVKNPYTRLFRSHRIFHVDGMKIMFIGIITSDVLSLIKKDSVLGNLVDVKDAAKEIGKICNTYKTSDIDFTVLLTHIGFEEDKRLAALLDPDWGIDVIIGGHSHTILEQPVEVNGVLIVQAGVGTDQIGRFDIVVDTDTNSVSEYKWRLIPIDSSHCPRDLHIEKTIMRYKNQTDRKYERVLCRLPYQYTHPSRHMETDLGNLFSDALKEALGLDIMIMASGSIRKDAIGPFFTHRDLIEAIPYDEKVYRLKISGRQLKQMYTYMLRDEAFSGEHTEFYQFSYGMNVVYDVATKTFARFDFCGKPIKEDDFFIAGMQGYHYVNFSKFFNIPIAEIEKNAKIFVISTSVQDVLEEYFSTIGKIFTCPRDRLIIYR